MTENLPPPLFFADELDPNVLGPLRELVSLSPEESQWQASLKRIGRQSPAMDLVLARRSAPRGRGMLAAAACLLLVLWFGAQTKAWGQVAQGFQRTAVSAVATADQIPIASPKKVGSVMRFVLIVHVFSLLAGMFGLMIVWMRSLWDWLMAIWRPTKIPHRTGKIHAIALYLYGLAIALGSCWSQVTFGTFWRWDPREAFALLTLCVGSVWYLSVDTGQGNSVILVIRRTVIASISFGLVMLMHGLAIPYSRQNPSYGLPSVVLTLLAANLTVVLTSWWWFARLQRSKA